MKRRRGYKKRSGLTYKIDQTDVSREAVRIQLHAKRFSNFNTNGNIKWRKFHQKSKARRPIYLPGENGINISHWGDGLKEGCVVKQYFSEFLALASIHLLAVTVPGPDFAVTVSQSIRKGRKAGIYIALGIGAGMSVHIIYMVLGLGALMHTSPMLMNVARIVGGAYILYFSYNLLKAKPAGPVEINGAVKSEAITHWPKLFWAGFLTNATNPKATLFFLAIFTTVVSSKTPVYIQMGYGAWMCFVNALWFVLVATFFTHRGVREQFLKMGHWFERLMGLLLMLFAVRLIWGMFG